MLNIDTLDTVIAVVLVLLVLSLIVQSIQSVLKKIFRLKSLQIEDSLLHLFQNILEPIAADAAADNRLQNEPDFTKSDGWMVRYTGSAPFLRRIYNRLMGTHPYLKRHPEALQLLNDVKAKFAETGRIAQSGQVMLDSISKEDLMRVMQRLPVERIAPGFSRSVGEFYEKIKHLEKEQVDAIRQQIMNLQDSVREIEHTYRVIMSEATGARFDAMAKSFAPLFPLLKDLQPVFHGNAINPRLILGDVINLRKIQLTETHNYLIGLRQSVQQDQAQAQNPELKAALGKLDRTLQEIGEAVVNLRPFESAFAALREQLNKLEGWYDTVMQGFEERYTRSMKTWTLVISFMVVFIFNANIFNIYRDAATSEAKRALILQSSGEIQRLVAARQSTEDTENTVKAVVDSAKKQIDENAAIYTGFGFTPFGWVNEIPNWRSGKGWENMPAWQRYLYPLWMILNWLLMMFLLSVGAPFWQDTLESLFGIKNLLRKKSDTKNVEKESGAGQPRP